MANLDLMTNGAKVTYEELCEKAAVTLFSRRLGAEEGDNAFESRRVAACGNIALAHQFEKRSLVRWPILGGAIGIADFRRRRKERLVFVGDPREAIEKKRDVGKFGEAGELAAAVFADINHLSDAGFAKEAEEFFSRLPGEANGAKRGIHAAVTSARPLPGQRGRRNARPEADRHLREPRRGRRGIAKRPRNPRGYEH